MEFLVIRVLEKGTDAGRSAWLTIVKLADYFERLWVDQFGGAVLRGGHKHGEIVALKHGEDLVGVDLFVLNEFFLAQIVDHDVSVACRHDQSLIQGSPKRIGEHIVLGAKDLVIAGNLFIFGAQDGVHIVDPHARLLVVGVGDQNLLVAVGEFNFS